MTHEEYTNGLFRGIQLSQKLMDEARANGNYEEATRYEKSMLSLISCWRDAMGQMSKAMMENSK